MLRFIYVKIVVKNIAKTIVRHRYSEQNYTKSEKILFGAI